MNTNPIEDAIRLFTKPAPMTYADERERSLKICRGSAPKDMPVKPLRIPNKLQSFELTLAKWRL
jgi:hypothetical protein